MSDPNTLRELRKISKILLLTNSQAVERELSKIASTNDRKKMWVLIDGKRMPKDIAKDIDVSERAVNYFVGAGQAAELIEYNKGEPPRKLLDYVPPSWLELVLARMTGETEATASTTPQAKLETSGQSASPEKTKGAEKVG